MLTKVVAKNFQSWDDLIFHIPPTVTLIDGWNDDDQTSEGSGKSAVLNAICWGLYGKIPKDANVDDVIREGEKSCAVLLEFDNGDQILRSRRPNDLYLKKSTGEVLKGKDSWETQTIIETYVGVSFETFCQSKYFAQNYDKKFLTSNQAERGKILSSIQDLDVFDKARKETMELIKLETENLNNLSKKFELSQNNVAHLRSKVNMMDSFIQSKYVLYEKSKKDCQSRITTIQDNVKFYETSKQGLNQKWETLFGNLNWDTEYIQQLNDSKTQLNESLAKVLAQKSQVDSYNKRITQNEVDGRKFAERYDRLAAKKEKLEAFITNPTSTCPTCGSVTGKIDTEPSLKELDGVNSEMADLLNRMTEIDEFLKTNPPMTAEEFSKEELKLRTKIGEIDSVTNKIKSEQINSDALKYEMMKVDSNKDAAENSLKTAINQLEQLQAPDVTNDLKDKMTLENDLQESVDTLKEVESLMIGMKLHLSRLEQLKDGFKDIKSYVFNNILNELNFKANKYLLELFEVEARVKFINEDQKIESKITLDSRETSLGLLSGGQSRRFNLAVDLALADIVTSRTGTKLNILALDEYFKDLSEISMEKCLNLLKSRKSPVLLIEHNSIFKNIVDQTFFVNLKNGVSYESR